MVSRAAAASPTTWPLDIRLMNGVSALVFVLSALILLAAAVAWLVRAPGFLYAASLWKGIWPAIVWPPSVPW